MRFEEGYGLGNVNDEGDECYENETRECSDHSKIVSPVGVTV